MFKKFERELDDYAQTWPNRMPELNSRYPEIDRHRPYVTAMLMTMSAIRNTTDDERVKQLTTSGGVIHGISAIARYYMHAAESAANQGVEYEKATTYLESATSHRLFGRLANVSNAVAGGGEMHLCIKRDDIETFEFPIDAVYQWQDETLHHPLLETALFERTKDAQKTGHEITGFCPAEKAHQLQSIARSVLTICTRDEQLLPTTYDRAAKK